METLDVLIVGAGPAGLRAAQVLAGAGRDVLVAEKHETIGPKTCAGGLTRKSVDLLRPLGLPDDAGLERVGQVAFDGECVVLHPERTVVRTLPRRELGRYQLAWARAAGAEVRSATPVAAIDLAARTARVGGRTVRWRHLVGADGSDSAVRRALALPSPRECFAAEYNVAGLRLEPLRVEVDPALAGGYFWIFPHCDYTSIGAVASKRQVRPGVLRRYLERRIARLGVDLAGVPFEGATLEVTFRGFHFAGNVHLAGDAAGVPSSLTAEGIYAALLTGEEVARAILDPGYPAERARRWLRVKRRHDRLERTLQLSAARAAVLPALARMARWRRARGALADWFLAG
jgi:geranylgeranyl reductase